MAEKSTDVATRERPAVAHRESLISSASPFRMLERFADEMDHLFDDFGFGRSWLSPRALRSRFTADVFAPEIEVFHRNNELIVRADLPGLKRDDIHVDVTDEAITISGERHQEQEFERGGVYQTERSYGSFSRRIPLPSGAIGDQAKASFKDGVLEIAMPAPPEQVRRGRRLEIAQGSEEKKK